MTEDDLALQLADARTVDAFMLTGATIPDAMRQGTDHWVNSRAARQLADSYRPPSQSRPEGGSPWQRAYLTALESSSPELLALAELGDWWDQNIRGRVWESPIAGLGFYLEGPPRRQAPYPAPTTPTAGLWITSTQQRSWWHAVRHEPGKHARRQATRWAELRDLAQPVYTEQIRSVLDLIATTGRAKELAATTNRRASLWV